MGSKNLCLIFGMVPSVFSELINKIKEQTAYYEDFISQSGENGLRCWANSS
jgi:hypothetical protein